MVHTFDGSLRITTYASAVSTSRSTAEFSHQLRGVCLTSAYFISKQSVFTEKITRKDVENLCQLRFTHAVAERFGFLEAFSEGVVCFLGGFLLGVFVCLFCSWIIYELEVARLAFLLGNYRGQY